MRKIQVIALLAMTLTLSTAVTAPAGPVIDRILKRGELAVGTSGDQPPLTIKTKEGNIIGLDVDLSKMMAGAMGVKLRLETMPFPELLPALQAGKIDMILSNMTMTPKRNLKVAYVGPYYIAGMGILTKAATLAAFQDVSDINEAGVTLVAVRRTTSQAFVEEEIPKAKLVTANTLRDALALLIEDKADALIAAYAYCALTAFRYKNKGLAVVENRFTFEPVGIALPEDDLLLVNWVDNVLETLEASGELQKLKDHWFKGGSWMEQLP